MPIPQAKRRLSCGVVIIRQTAADPLFLLLKAYTNWDFPKGMVETGEQPLDAAIREVREETTITDLQFPWGYKTIDTGPYSKGKISRYFVGSTATVAVSLPVNPELGRPEHSAWRWVTFAEAHQLAAPRVVSVLNWVEIMCPELLATA